MRKEMGSVLTLEEAISLASQEVSKAIIHEEKSTVWDSQVSICVEEIKLASEENLVKTEPLDVYNLPCNKPQVTHDKDYVPSRDEKMQSSVILEDSMSISELSVERNVSFEVIVRQLQAEVAALRKKRADEGRANEKVVSIYASREQAWKAERRRFVSEQKRLWQELQRAFMEQEVLKQRTRHLSSVQDGDFDCEECEQKEGWLIEMKERLREQEFIIMASMEEAKVEQNEKNSIAAKVATLEASFCDVNEKLRLEAEGRSEDLQKHKAALTEVEESCKVLEREKIQAFLELERVQKSFADVILEKNRYEDLIAEMSAEIDGLQVGGHEKDDIISAMLKKADTDAGERHDLERELTAIKAKLLHLESEKEKSHKYMHNTSPCMGREMMKPRRSLGSKAENGFEKMRDLQRLHDVEIRELQTAFEEEVRLLKKRLSLFQERVADLEETVLLRLANNVRQTNSIKDKHMRSYAEDRNGVSVFGEHVEPDKTSQGFQLSIARTLLRQYADTDVQREQEIEKWKKAYFASKATIEMLHKENGHIVSSPRSRGLVDWLELERARSKLEQRHLQEINAFERQLKARDERMEAFRQQLLAMESEGAQRRAEIESVQKDLKSVKEEKAQLQELMLGKEKCNSWET